MLNPGAWDWGNYAGFFWVSQPPSTSPPNLLLLSLSSPRPSSHPTLPICYLCLRARSQGGSAFLCVIYVYFRVPEPTGRSFAELDLLFQQGVSARKFATTKVNVFEEDIDGDFMSQYHQKAANEQRTE